MKFFKVNCLAVSVLILMAGAAMALDQVDIGNTTSESGHNLISWGPIEPENSSGYYGGIDACRGIWTSGDTPVAGSRDAYIDMSFLGGSELVSFKHLDGPADDSFEVWMGQTKMFTYDDSGLPGERWYVSGFNHTPLTPGIYTLRFEATGTQWINWQAYGQVCIAGVWIGPGGPVPSDNSTWGGVKALFR